MAISMKCERNGRIISNTASRAAASNSAEIANKRNAKAIGSGACCGSKNFDELSRIILGLLAEAGEPVETKEIEARVGRLKRGATRIKVLYRLQNLRAEGAACGKFVGPGKGVWVWWTNSGHSVKR